MQSELKNLAVIGLPNDSYAFNNALYINQAVYTRLCSENPESAIYFELKGFVLPVKGDNMIKPNTLSLGNIQRMMMKISKIDTLSPQVFIPTKDNVSKLLSIAVDIEIAKKAPNAPPVLEVDEKKLEDIYRKSFVKHFMNVNEMLLMDYEGSALILNVKSIKVVEQTIDETIEKSFGEIDGDTEIRFHVAGKSSKILKIRSDKIRETELFKVEFNFEKLGIGGLDAESSMIFRRAFNSRRYPPAIIKKYGIKHVKGMLLYGPPGTGKTLIARKIAEVLKAHEPKLVNGPEIFSKFVGDSEKNIRELFADAEKEEKEAGEDSKLHIIIFDEIDAICKPRGSVSSGVAVHDTVVNQILSKLDGVESLNNILVIGMTNRKDMIDEAVLRPGRLEVHVEIGLPDEIGRVQIFRIHTRTMKENGLLGEDVDLEKLARLTKNYSGAEIEGVVRGAAGFALFEGTSMAGIQVKQLAAGAMKKVAMRHFMQALEEVKPQFGIDTDELGAAIRNGIIDFGPAFSKVLEMGKVLIEQVRSSPNTPLFSVLVQGRKGAGKTAFAANLGLESKFPYVKLITPESYVGYSDQGKVFEINKIFNDSYKSPLSVIILDDIERLIEYIHVGPRFSNAVLQALLVLIKKLPPHKDRKLFIIGTTSMSSTLRELGIVDSFNTVITLPVLKQPEEVQKVLESYNVEEEEKRKIAESGTYTPIKYLLLTLEMALQKGHNKLTSGVFQQCLSDILKGESSDVNELPEL
eukprot:TRINITY_DN1848_c0_g1_i7.p1 TRINITY_DN1848_c0_g1~~TRINITY_DN1848_c0_g1_i7.p1  ORF type:complete len:747 (+),score=237.39 TRINITY_DN1848_c0_g1_i7:194-2434(+)